MPDHNPYTPPATELAEGPLPPSRVPRWLVAGFIALQWVLFACFLPTTWDYIATGVLPAGPQLIVALGQLSLLAGAVMLAVSRVRGRRTLLAATILLGLGSVLSWNEPFFILPWLYRAGFVAALAGWRVARPGAQWAAAPRPT